MSDEPINQLSKAYQIAAKVVALYGDAYLPVFERLHDDLENLKKKQDKKQLALHVADDIADK